MLSPEVCRAFIRCPIIGAVFKSPQTGRGPNHPTQSRIRGLSESRRRSFYTHYRALCFFSGSCAFQLYFVLVDLVGDLGANDEVRCAQFRIVVCPADVLVWRRGKCKVKLLVLLMTFLIPVLRPRRLQILQRRRSL